MFLVSPFDAEYCNVLGILFSTDRWLVVHYCENRFHSRRSLSFTTLSAVHMYDFHIFTVIYSSLHGFIWNKHNEHFPVSLVAQLIERWSGWIFYFFIFYFSIFYFSIFYFFKALFLILLKKCSLMRRFLSFQIGERWRSQSFGKCTDSLTNQFSNMFMVNLV